MSETITTETLDSKAAKYQAEFDRCNEALSKLREQQQNFSQQIQTTFGQMRNLQGALLSLQELKADATGGEPDDIPEIEPEDVPKPRENEGATE